MSSRFKFCPQCTKPLIVTHHGGLQRPACADAACGFVLWDNPVPVVAAIVEHEGEIILARNRQWPPKMFALITGFLEKDDPSPEVGVLREVEEELGLIGRIGEFIGHYPFERMNQLIIAYHIIAEGQITLGDELAEYKKLPAEKIRPWPAGTGYAVRDWLVRRGITPLPFDRNMMRRPRNWHEINPKLLTAGQPTAEDLLSLHAIGVDTVINLAMPCSDHALPDEQRVVEQLGMRYVPIPVVWEKPTIGDFEKFSAAMQTAGDSTVFVHCAANKRVSSFVFLHRVLKCGVPLEEAERDLHAVWKPEGVWQEFIQKQI